MPKVCGRVSRIRYTKCPHTSATTIAGAEGVRLLDMGWKLIGQQGNEKTIRFLWMANLNIVQGIRFAKLISPLITRNSHLNNFTTVICFAAGESDNGRSAFVSSLNLAGKFRIRLQTMRNTHEIWRQYLNTFLLPIDVTRDVKNIVGNLFFKKSRLRPMNGGCSHVSACIYIYTIVCVRLLFDRSFLISVMCCSVNRIVYFTHRIGMPPIFVWFLFFPNRLDPLGLWIAICARELYLKSDNDEKKSVYQSFYNKYYGMEYYRLDGASRTAEPTIKQRVIDESISSARMQNKTLF